MENIKVYAHGSYIGTTGYNNHTRDFFRELSNHCDIKFRNFTVAKYWTGYNKEPHNREDYLNDTDKKILHEQTVWVDNGKRREDRPIYSKYSEDFDHDFNLVLSETNHHYFYDTYNGPKIAYNVWESTLQPQGFFNKLREFDELWVPSEWQKECSIKQGFDPERVQVVPEGVDVDTFFPEEVDVLDEYKDGRFKFLLFGRWDYRKSTKEIIQTFLKTFRPDEPVDLVVSIDNMWGEQMDGHKNTVDRLKAYNLLDDRVKILSFPSREDYIKYIKTGHVFLSCARAEGWNLPLIEAMACGTPSIYSNCSAQLEFAEGKGIPVNVVGERAASDNDYARYTMSDLDGNYYEPDFDHLSKVMRDTYENYESYKTNAIEESKIIHEDFNWSRVAEIGYEKLKSFKEKISSEGYTSPSDVIENEIQVTYVNEPKVEVTGNKPMEYFIEFVDGDTNEIVHSTTILNNMWTSCNRKYYTNWIIRINGKVHNRFNVERKKVLISLDSKSIGDTLAWAPYAVEFAKQHNCKVALSTFHNKWFINNPFYQDIEFLHPGQRTQCYSSYTIGWFRDDDGGWEKYDMYPNQVNMIPLQKTATDILGLEYKEINYGVHLNMGLKPIKQKYAVIGPQATAGCKEWTIENWTILTKMLKSEGYKVVVLSSNPYNIEGTKNIYGKSWDEVATYLWHADLFIGLGSGLSWFNWALGKFTYMINGFVEEGHEFTKNMKKITTNTCIKCWNDPVHVFDAGDWDWCPVYKGTKLQHICQKSITPLQVFNELDLNGKN